MERRYRSVYDNYEHRVDCRCLTLAFEFYDMDRSRLSALSRFTLDWIASVVKEDFIQTWSLRGRKTPLEKLKSIFSDSLDPADCAFSMDGFVKTESIRIKRDVIDQLQRCRDIIVKNNCYHAFSNEYYHYWNTMFPDGQRPYGEVINGVKQLFSEPSRKNMSLYNRPEIHTVFISWPYSNNAEKFHGQFYISICAHCLHDFIDEQAELFATQLYRTAEKFVNLNGRVMLQPFSERTGHSPYMKYFGTRPCVNNSHIEVGCKKDEWYETYYLCGVEWANIISPLTRRHIPELTGKSCIEGVLLSELQGGALGVCSGQPITKFDIEDMRLLKKTVYNALYPGSWHMSLHQLFEITQDTFFIMNAPRSQWEIVSILDSEINVFLSSAKSGFPLALIEQGPVPCLAIAHNTVWEAWESDPEIQIYKT